MYCHLAASGFSKFIYVLIVTFGAAYPSLKVDVGVARHLAALNTRPGRIINIYDAPLRVFTCKALLIIYAGAGGGGSA
jgi:hypothetical protein